MRRITELLSKENELLKNEIEILKNTLRRKEETQCLTEEEAARYQKALMDIAYMNAFAEPGSWSDTIKKIQTLAREALEL